MPINNPLPSSLRSECRKAARILTSFVDPKQAFGPDKIIPPSILANAKGLAIFTVVKGGFLLTFRGGSGLVIARRPDGKWSAPSAIGTAGAGFGGQIGAELTDFVMILNDANAVKTFAQAGSMTLGGNVSVAAGPIGRNAEAAGAASLKSVAGIFSYSKTKGLFAGVSLEGSVIVERKDANSKFYGSPIPARQLLSGNIPPPPDADVLIRILNSRIFSGNSTGGNYDDIYNDIPKYDDRRDSFVWDDSADSPTQSNSPTEVGRRGSLGNVPSPLGSANRDRSSTWSPSATSPVSVKGPAPGRPTAPKPRFNPNRASTLGPNQAIALYSFEAAQPGDLAFKKGDIITITKRSDSKNDWWTGEIGSRQGIFPSNYVETV